MEHPKLVANFQTLNAFLSELQNNMNSAIPEIYLKLQEQDNKEVGQSFLSNLFWNAFDLIGSIEALPQREIISWVLGAFVESIHDNLEKYPNLNENISSCYERMTETITTIKDTMIAPVVSYPDQHINDVWTYKNKVVKVSDFDTFDFFMHLFLIMKHLQLYRGNVNLKFSENVFLMISGRLDFGLVKVHSSVPANNVTGDVMNG